MRSAHSSGQLGVQPQQALRARGTLKQHTAPANPLLSNSSLLWPHKCTQVPRLTSGLSADDPQIDRIDFLFINKFRLSSEDKEQEMTCNLGSKYHLINILENVRTITRLGKSYPRRMHTGQDKDHTWSILKHIYQGSLKNWNQKYACFLLNLSDDSQTSFEKYKFVWDEANLKVAVDGSANYLAKRRALHTADVISGDFDSIDHKLIERLQSPRKANKSPTQQDNRNLEVADGVHNLPQVVETPCQKETDFTKAIRVALGIKPDIQNFIGLYYSDGHRLDHMFGLVNTLHIIKKKIFILGVQGGAISWVLPAGCHTIQKPKGQELCSLIPLTGPTEVKTSGLRYNLGQFTQLSFGGLISTSNICSATQEKIEVETNKDLLWTLDLDMQSPSGHKVK